VTAPLPSVTIQWQRQTTWGLLLPVVCSDMAPRSREGIASAILARYRQEAAGRVSLDGFCAEAGDADGELAASVSRAVEDAVTKRHLVGATKPATGYVLSGLTDVADEFFRRARSADDLDLLFVGRYRASWEQELFASEFGRAYVRSAVFPAVERAYSVRLTQRPPTEPVRLLLESCPAAARLVRYNAPSADNLVKDSLLAQATLTGALIDLHSDPERLLDGTVRGAVRALAAGNAAVGQTIRLLEELALLGGLTHEQVSAAVLPSEAAQAALEAAVPPEAGTVTIHVAQTMPPGAAESSHLHRLLLASRRAEVPILLTANADHDLTLQVEGAHELANQDMAGVVVGVGPAAPMPASFRLPARVEVSRPTRTIRLILGRFSANAPTAYPVIVTLPAPHAQALPLRVTLASSIQWPELTVRDWRALESANQVIRSSSARIELVMEEGGHQLGVLENPQGNVLFPLWPGPDVVRDALRGLDGAAPAPVRVPPQTIAGIAGMTESERGARWHAEEDYHSTPGRRVSSLFIRFTNSEGRPFDERFLRFLSFNFFPAPTFETDHPSGPRG
jgi:hypothetical protein